MQGRLSGVAARIRQDVPQALPVHCLAHSLNLCLQDSGRKITLLRDALDIVREIVQLINKSPKRKHLFSEKLITHDSVHKGLKQLCPTRWTVRAEAMDAVLKQYKVIIETMEEVHSTTHDEYGLKAGGIVTALEKRDTLFGLKLGHLHILFGCAENTSKVLQAKDLLIQEATCMSAVNVTQAFYQRQRQDDAFNVFYDSVVKGAEELEIGEPVLPRYRKAPRRYDDGAPPHVQFSDPRSFYRQKYFEACDLLIQELHDRFGQREVMKPIVTLQSLLLKSANGEECIQELSDFKDSVYRQEFTVEKLEKQLGILADVIRVELPEVKKVTSVRSICDASAKHGNTNLLSEVHKLLQLYLTIPITSCTSERSFSALRRLFTYLRSTMTEKWLNNCFLLHVQKELTDSINVTDVTVEFTNANDERTRYFGSFTSAL